MAQKQTKRAEQGKDPLVCTYGNCKSLQCEDGEFCKDHMFDDKNGTACTKCGNPLLMFWCSDCEINNERHNCDECGNPCSVDKEYHDNCN